MNAFLDYMIDVCIIAIIVGGVLGIWVYGWEFILTKLNLQDKFVNFMFGPGADEPFEDEEE